MIVCSLYVLGAHAQSEGIAITALRKSDGSPYSLASHGFTATSTRGVRCSLSMQRDRGFGKWSETLSVGVQYSRMCLVRDGR
jgi:hypothetical protein